MKYRQDEDKNDPAQKHKSDDEPGRLKEREISQSDQDLQSGSDGGEAVLTGRPREGTQESPPAKMPEEQDD